MSPYPKGSQPLLRIQPPRGTNHRLSPLWGCRRRALTPRRSKSLRLRATIRSHRQSPLPSKPPKRRRPPASLSPPPSLHTCLLFSPTLLRSLQDHLSAYTLRYLKRLLLRQLLRDILTILFNVFAEVCDRNSVLVVSHFYCFIAEKPGVVLFIILLSRVRLKITSKSLIDINNCQLKIFI